MEEGNEKSNKKDSKWKKLFIIMSVLFVIVIVGFLVVLNVEDTPTGKVIKVTDNERKPPKTTTTTISRKEQFLNSPSNVVKIIPSEMVEYGYLREYHRSCATLEAMAESQGVSNIKQKLCREACGKRSMDYYSYECGEADLFICYCKE